MPEYTVMTSPGSKVFDVGMCKDVNTAGWRFKSNPPRDAAPTARVHHVSRTGHEAWFPWPGAVPDEYEVIRVKATYKHQGEDFTEELYVRGINAAEAQAELCRGNKKIVKVEEVGKTRGLTEAEEEELEDFIEAWNG